MSNPKPPSTCWLFILCVCYGWTGAHHLSLGRECQALLWYTSFGLFGLGVLVDVFLLPTYRKFLVDSIGGEEQDETEQTHSSLSLQEVLLADHLNPNVGSPKRSTTRSRPSDKTSVCSSLWGCIVRALGGSFFGAYYDVIASFASTALDLVLDPLGGTLGDALRARLCVKAFARSVAVWLCCNAGARTSHLMLVIVIGFALEIFFEAFFGGTFYGDINKGIVTEFEEEETQGLEQSFLCSFVLSVITLAFATRKRTFQELRPRPYWRRWLAWSSAIFVFWTAILAGFVYHFEMVNSKGEVQTVLDMASEFFESTEWLQVKAIFGRYANITKEQGLSAGLQSFVEDLQQEMEGSRDRGSTGGGKRGSKRGRGGDWEGAEGDEESEEDEEGGWAWAWFEENINWALGTFSGKSDWKTLGVSPGASDDEIKDKYRQLARKYHPDKNRGREKEAEAQMAEINAAYARLVDNRKRGARRKRRKTSEESVGGVGGKREGSSSNGSASSSMRGYRKGQAPPTGTSRPFSSSSSTSKWHFDEL